MRGFLESAEATSISMRALLGQSHRSLTLSGTVGACPRPWNDRSVARAACGAILAYENLSHNQTLIET